MATAQQFEDLGVWQDARALSKLIYSVTKQREFYRDIDLRRQIRAAALALSRRIAKFVRYLETCPANTRTRKPGKR